MIYNKYIFFILFILFHCYNCYFDVCVVGSSGGLGKELVYQSLINKNLKVLALTSNKNGVKIPYRGGGLNDNYDNLNIINKNLIIDNYWEDINYKYNYKSIIFATSSTAFQKDYSLFLTKKLLRNLSRDCKSINLVSAYGVGETLKDANLGIKIMENFYLREVYYAKNKQEEFINNYQRDLSKFKNPIYINKLKYIKKNIYRPKLLTFGDNIFNAQTRENLATIILDNLFD